MNKHLLLCAFALSLFPVFAQQATVKGPDSNLKVDISVKEGKPFYTVTYKNNIILEDLIKTISFWRILLWDLSQA